MYAFSELSGIAQVLVLCLSLFPFKVAVVKFTPISVESCVFTKQIEQYSNHPN